MIIKRVFTASVTFALAFGLSGASAKCDPESQECGHDEIEEAFAQASNQGKVLIQKEKVQPKHVECNPSLQNCHDDETEEAVLEASHAGSAFIQAKAKAKRDEAMLHIGKQLHGYNKGVKQTMDTLKQIHGVDRVTHSRKVKAFQHSYGTLHEA
mmetsp:Transcript_100107/g.198576  ORF Transcript_100107/g.198576 Transcript_100107/m.198576 type:complete len:154 (+) Transcript_100107:92-553(+)